MSEDRFEKDGETINFQRVAPTATARDPTALEGVRLAGTSSAEPLSLPAERRRKRRGRSEGTTGTGGASTRADVASVASPTSRPESRRRAGAVRRAAKSARGGRTASAEGRKAPPGRRGTAKPGGGATKQAQATTRPLDPKTAALADALRAWRLAEARKTRAPAFRVLTDRTLLGIAAERPRSPEALRAIPGFGPKTAASYTHAILRVLDRALSAPDGA